MKTTLLLLLAVVLLVNAKRGDPPLQKGEQLMDWMEGTMKGTYIVMFYDQDGSSRKTSQTREQITSLILDKYPNFHYYEIDVTDKDHQSMVSQMEIDPEDLKHSPTTLVASDGRGFWAHGKGSVQEIAYRVPYYSSDLRVPDYPTQTRN